MPLQLKLILAAILLVLIGAEHYWVFNQGQKVGQAGMISQTAAAVSKALVDQAATFKKTRDREMEQAAHTAVELNQNNIKLASDLQKAKNALKDNPAASARVPVDVVKLLNSAADGSSPSA